MQQRSHDLSLGRPSVLSNTEDVYNPLKNWTRLLKRDFTTKVSLNPFKNASREKTPFQITMGVLGGTTNPYPEDHVPKGFIHKKDQFGIFDLLLGCPSYLISRIIPAIGYSFAFAGLSGIVGAMDINSRIPAIESKAESKTGQWLLWALVRLPLVLIALH